jgi:transcriptional regulator with XRE-family HTH domain
MDSFGALLRSHVARRGISQAELADAIGVARSTVAMFMSDDPSRQRKPSGADLVLRIAQTLELTDDETDRLLAAAGFLPAAYHKVQLTDPDIHLVVRVLGDQGISENDKTWFRIMIRALAGRWYRPGKDIESLLRSYKTGGDFVGERSAHQPKT